MRQSLSWMKQLHIKNGSFYDLSGKVCSVFQNPRTQFFTVDTTSEIAFGCENLAIDAEQIEQRICTTVDEPSSNLDIAAIGELKKILKQWKAQGKTTFANVLCGLVKKANGHLWMNGKEYKAKQRLKLCCMVMQDVNHQLFTESELCDFRMERGK